MNPLDRPIWWALATRQSQFARGHSPALAFRADVEPFAAAFDDSEQSLLALSALCDARDILLLAQRCPSPPLPRLEALGETLAVQMVAQRAIHGDLAGDAVPLGERDADEMVALATMTKPGPFRASTHELGQFWGIRRDGRLVAMAGERLKVPGFSELSGVCTHPDWQGRGYGRQLSALVAGKIQARGETPFLHAYADNSGAIKLYEQLGFEVRSELAIQTFGHAPAEGCGGT
jgi:predicted GNAT family acetyltransferase